MDKIFTDIAERVPGFGGFFLDERGDLVVFVTDPTRGTAAEQAARDFLESLDPRERPHIQQFRVRKGDYDFRDLLGWRYGLTSVLTIPGVVFIDVDEGLNRVRVGIDSPNAAQSVFQMALGSGMPLNALVVEDVGPFKTISTLQDSVRPIEGGIGINSNIRGCTLGFLAERNEVLVFITDSHCTNTQGGVEGTIFAQPSATDEYVGLEQVDPAYTALHVRLPPGAGKATALHSYPIKELIICTDTFFERSLSAQALDRQQLMAHSRLRQKQQWPYRETP